MKFGQTSQQTQNSKYELQLWKVSSAVLCFHNKEKLCRGIEADNGPENKGHEATVQAQLKNQTTVQDKPFDVARNEKDVSTLIL